MDDAARDACGNARIGLEFQAHSGGFGLTVPNERNGDISKAPSPPDPYAVSAAQTQSNDQTAAYEAALNRVNQVTPLGTSTWNGTGPGATQTVTLTPQAQQDLTNQLNQDVNLSALGNNLTTQAGTSLQGHIDTSGLPALSGAPTGTGNIQSGLNFSNAPGITDTNQAIQQAQNAVYGQAASRLDPQWTNNQNDLNAQLANQGVVQGSEAYNRAQTQLSNAKNDAYNQANYSAIQTGDALQNQLYNQQLGTRQEAVGEDTTAGNFANSAQAQQYGQGLSGAALNDQARSQGLTEQTQLQELPLNELNALRSQSQVQQPSFSSVPQSTVAPTNVAGNVYSSYNAQTANANNFMNGLFGLGSSALMAFG